MRTDLLPAVPARVRRAAAPAASAIAAALAVAFAAPVWLTTALTVVAFLLTAERLVRRRQLGWADACATAAAGLIVVLMLLGFLLDETPGGLARVPWAVGAGVVALVAIGWAERQTAPGAAALDIDRPAIARLAPAYAIGAGLAVVALLVSVHATTLATTAPAALSLRRDNGAGEVSVEVSGGRTTTSYELVVAAGGLIREESAPFEVARGRTVRRTVEVPAARRSVIELRASGSSRTLRSLVVSPSTVVRVTP